VARASRAPSASERQGHVIHPYDDRELRAGARRASATEAQQRPPVGLYGSPPDAMIFYVAHGPPGACGPGCSDWIAAEGAVQWDSYKRLIAILDRQAGHKLPLVIHSRGASNLNVAVSIDCGCDRGRGLRRQTRGGVFCAEAARRAARCQG
jgi:hypothetical protein